MYLRESVARQKQTKMAANIDGELVENLKQILFKDFIYLCFREGEREREGNTNVWFPLVCSYWEPGSTQACVLN